MTSLKIFVYVVGTMACIVGGLLSLCLLFPGYAIDHGITDEGLKSLFIMFMMWMFLFAISLHVYVGEMRGDK